MTHTCVLWFVVIIQNKGNKMANLLKLNYTYWK